MAPSPVVITQKAVFINADTNVHKADSLRRVTDQLGAVGVVDLNSWRVRQKVSGAAGSVDVTDAATVSKAFVRGSSVNEQGLYLVGNVAPTTGAIDAIYNVDIAIGDATNPRIDQVFLCVEDAQHAGSNNQVTIRVVAGTPTGGATLDNRTGAGAAPAGMSSILLADVLQPAVTTNVVTANIRDRRPVANMGTVPWLGSTGTQIDMVALEPHFGHVLNIGQIGVTGTIIAGTHDNLQAAALVWLPRRIVGATRIRWGYMQGATANAGNYALWLADASGRVVAQTAATAFAGAANVVTAPSVALLATTTLEAGWYWKGIGVGAMTASSTVFWPGMLTAARNAVGRAIPYPNIALRAAAGGTTVPTTILAFGDISTIAGAQDNVAVPLAALSVT